MSSTADQTDETTSQATRASHDDVQRTLEAVWRMEAAKVTAVVARVVGDVGLAEDLAQDAFVQALEQWPRDGIPTKPGAWLTATARRRAIDRIRRDVNLASKLQQVGHMEELRMAELAEGDFDAALEDIDDDVLGLVFAACHPALTAQARISLTLRMIGGLTTREIARAFLTTEPTIAQRISRAKKTLSQDGVTIEVPSGAELAPRLASVLEVVYLIFNEGYAATSGRDWVRGDLMEEAIRLGRVLSALAPGEPEVHGLLALMEIQASRTRARIGRDGEPVLLLDQDRTKWDWALIRHALAALERAVSLVDPGRGATGPYVLQAAIAACHARARTRRRHRLGAHRRALLPARSRIARRPSSTSTVRWPCPTPTGRPRRSRSSTGSWLQARSPTTTCCRASVATCSPASAATRRPAPSSPARPG